MRPLIATCLILALSIAGAWTMPSDAQVVLTAEDGTIVGVGHAYDGTHFDLELLAGFEGPARLLIVQPTGDALTFDALVRGDVVLVDTATDPGRVGPVDAAGLVDLTQLLEASGFVALAIGARDAGAPGRTTASGARAGSPADARTDVDDAGGPDDRVPDEERPEQPARGRP